MVTTASTAAVNSLQSTSQAAGAAAAAPAPPPPAAGRTGSSFLKRARLGPGIRLNLARFSRKLINTFGAMDVDGSGKLSHTEFFAGLAAANVMMTTSEFDQLSRLMDKSGDGFVDFNELVEGLYLLSTEHEAKVDKQFMAGGEALHLAVQPPVSVGAAEAGVWPIGSRGPEINRERRAGIVTPWAERAATSMKGLTATEWAQRRRREQKKSDVEEDVDYRWPAPVPQSKRPKPYALPRTATPRSRPWSPRVGAAEIDAAAATARSQRASSVRPQTVPKLAAVIHPPRTARPVTRGEQAKIARAQFYETLTVREEQAVLADKHRLASAARAASPYSPTKAHRRLSEELSRPSNRLTPPRPRTAPSSDDIARILSPQKASLQGALSPRLSSPMIGIYLPSACGPAPPLRVPSSPVPGGGSRRRVLPRQSLVVPMSPGAVTVSMAFPPVAADAEIDIAPETPKQLVEPRAAENVTSEEQLAAAEHEAVEAAAAKLADDAAAAAFEQARAAAETELEAQHAAEEAALEAELAAEDAEAEEE